MSLLLLAGPTQDDTSLAELVLRLGEKNTDRYDAFRSLLALRDPRAIPLLVRALPDFDATSQGLGVQLLQSYPAPLSHPALRGLLQSKSNFLVLCSAVALHRARQAGALEHAAKALQSEQEPAVLSMMFSRLYRIDEPRIAAAARARLVPTSGEPLLEAVLSYLFSIRDLSAKAPVLGLLEAPDLSPAGRATLSAFLYALGESGQAEPLAAALREGAVESNRFYRIYAFLSEAPVLTESIQAALLDFLERQTGDGAVVQILQLFEKFPYPPATRAIRTFLTHKTQRIASAAFAALISHPGASLLPLLRELLRDGEDGSRLLAADLLRRLDDPSGLPVVLAMLGRESPQRSEAIRILGGFRDPTAIPPLIQALEDADVVVRRHAYQGLITLLPALFPYRRFQFGALYDPQGPAQARRAGAERIREWWAAARERGW